MDIRGSRSPAMTDVARLAGVSHQTVSRVLNGHPNVKEQTRLRVRAAMKPISTVPRALDTVDVATGDVFVKAAGSKLQLLGPAGLRAAA